MQAPGTLSDAWSVWRSAILRGVLTLALLGLGLFAALTVLEIPIAPWIRSFGLWPTLTGNWNGTLETANGRVSFVYFEIRGEVFKPGSRGARRPNIYGTARWCDESGRIWHYRISGGPDNWRGTMFHLSTRGEVERDSGVALGDLRGEWSGDEIRAVGALVPLARTATVEATESSRPSAAPPLVRYTLNRGDEKDFLAACGTKG
jgi:hypothetical protein